MKRTTQTAILVILLLIGVAAAGTAGYRLWSQQADYRRSNALYEKLQKEYVAEPAQTGEDEPQEPPEWFYDFSVDVAALMKENPDCIGWLYQEDYEEINYPILWSGDDDTYLHHGFDGQYYFAGCIFLEGENTPDFTDSHSIIYGHNMRNLSMFGTLKHYFEDGYFEAHPYFQIRTATQALRYHVFAYANVSQDSFVYTVPYAPDEAFADFLGRLYGQSAKDTGVAAGKEDKIITFSTCSSTGRRTVVHAVLEDSYSYEH